MVIGVVELLFSQLLGDAAHVARHLRLAQRIGELLHAAAGLVFGNQATVVTGHVRVTP